MTVSSPSHETHLDSIELENFLSFRKGEVSFKKGDGSVSTFCVITGPNGSGKSSIFQALKFVFGSNSKDGRYNKWEEFICHGQEFMKVTARVATPKGMRTFSRALRRGSTSRFLLDNKQVTAQELVSVVRGLGIDPENIFQFIVQGNVNAINKLSPKEIYSLIENGIGLATLREKIEANSRKLHAIGAEIESLGIQRETCGRKDELLEEKLKLLEEKRHLMAELARVHAEMKWVQKVSIEHEIAGKELMIDQKKESMEIEREKITALDSYQQLHADMQALLEAESAGVIERLQEAQARSKELQAKINTWSVEKKSLFNENQLLIEQKANFKKDLKEKEEGLSTLRRDRDNLTTRQASLHEEISVLEKRRDEIFEKLMKHESWLVKQNKLKETISEHEKQRLMRAGRLGQQEKELERLIKSFQEVNDDIKGNEWYFQLDASIEDPRKYVEGELDKIESELARSHALLANGKQDEANMRRAFGKQLGRGQGARGLPREIEDLSGEIKERGYEERMKGPIYEHLVFDPQHARALDAVFKKHALLGFVAFSRSDFNLLNSLRNKVRAPCMIYKPRDKSRDKYMKPKPVHPGVIDYLINMVTVPDWLEGIAADIIGDTILVRTFSDGVTLVEADDRARCVTLDGIIVDSSKHALKAAPRYHGPVILSGGGTDMEDSTELQLEHLSRENQELEAKIARLKKEKERLTTMRHDASRMSIWVKQKQRMSTEKEQLLQNQDDCRAEIAAIDEEIRIATASLEEHNNSKPPTLVDLTDELESVRGSIEGKQEELNDIAEQEKDLNVEIGGWTLEHRVLKDRLATVNAEHVKLKATIKKIASDFQDTMDRINEISDLIKSFGKEKGRVKLAISLEKELAAACREELDNCKLKIKMLDMELQKMAEEKEALEKELSYAALLLQGQVKPEQLLTLEEYEVQALKLTEKLQSPDYLYINEGVVREHEENRAIMARVDEKLGEITSEQEEILAANETLKSEYVARIKEFVGQLQARVNDKFRSVGIPFAVLLEGGGTFEQPVIDISIDFFNGTPQSITGLSEGQKSLVSLAIMLSLQDMNPGPLCVFDEAHIFLDDSNKELVSRLIKKTTEQVQLLMLVPTTSHGFIRFGDKIIGVVRQGMKTGKGASGPVEGDMAGSGVDPNKLGPSQAVEVNMEGS